MKVNLDVDSKKLPNELKSALIRDPPYGNQENFIEAYDNAYNARGYPVNEFPLSWFIWWFLMKDIREVSVTVDRKIVNFKIVNNKLIYHRREIEITTFADLYSEIENRNTLLRLKERFTDFHGDIEHIIEISEITEYFEQFKAKLRLSDQYFSSVSGQHGISKNTAEFAIEPFILSNQDRDHNSIGEIMNDIPVYVAKLMNKITKYGFGNIKNDLMKLLKGWFYNPNFFYSYIIDDIGIKFNVVAGEIRHGDSRSSYNLALPIIKIKYYAVNVGEFERNILPHLDMLNGYKSGRWSDEDLIKYAADNWDIHEKDIDATIHTLDSLINSTAILEQ